jgi:hypothetical protein
VFAVERISHDKTSHIIALHNVTGKALKLDLPKISGTWRDLLSDTIWNGQAALSLEAYQICWLRRD